MISDKSFEEMLASVDKRFTPEYFEQLKQNSYKQDREYPENFSNWYPNIVDFGKLNHVDIINNQILTLEETKVLEQEDYNKVDWNKLNEILKPTLDKMKPYTTYNLKNGCYSNKFEFDTSLVTKQNLAQQLWKINYMSTLHDTGGYTEIVLRELIPNTLPTQHLTIYNGMPLRDEYRVFYNMDTKQVEYIVDYWNYEYCSEYLKPTDKLVFDYFHNKLKYKNVEEETSIYNQNLKRSNFETESKIVKEKVLTLKFNDKMKGIWSIDILKEGNEYYLIDMARGFRSAYWSINKLSEESRNKILNETNE